MFPASAESASGAQSVDGEDNERIARHASFERRLRCRALNIVSEADRYMHKHHLKPASDWGEDLCSTIGGGVETLYANTSDLSVVSFETVESFDRTSEDKAFVIVDNFPKTVKWGAEDTPSRDSQTDTHAADPSPKCMARRAEYKEYKQSLVVYPETNSLMISVPSHAIQSARQHCTLQYTHSLQELQQLAPLTSPPALALRPFSSQYLDREGFVFGQKQCLKLVRYAFSTLSCLMDDYCYQTCKKYFGGDSKKTNGSRSLECEFELADMKREKGEEAQHNRALEKR